jgi:hypothetical protein
VRAWEKQDLTLRTQAAAASGGVPSNQ